jgi:hypothetical protein
MTMTDANDNKSNIGASPSGNHHQGTPDGENTSGKNTNRTKDDGLSGRAEQEETANNYTYLEGHDEEDIEDMNSLKGIMKNRDERKEDDNTAGNKDQS